MENSSSASLKKLKREVAQRRKAQARSLKLRAEEQERLQRLEIDALVEQQRLQRLERQRCEEDAARLAQQQEAAVFDSSSSSSGNNNNNNHQQHPAAGSQISDGKHASCKGSSNCKQQLLASSRSCSNNMPADEKSNKSSCKDIAAAGAVAGGWRGKESQRAKQVQQQSMRAAVESRRRLARGPRSGVLPDNAHGGANNSEPMLPSEDHRVVSTEYQAAGTQALMRVTLLAAGFVIGARGISARLIGQVTGAIVQSWTESCRPDSVPIRLFRIQGKKGVVQAAVHLIEQAVAKYKDLCDCKRRGEFVQREHIINGVEFYYQPPPRKAFATPADQPPGSAGNCFTSGGKQLAGGSEAVAHGSGQANCNGQVGGAAAQQLPFAPHHAWLQHLQQQHQAQAAAAQQHKQAQAAAIHHEANQVHEGHGQNHRSMGRPQYAFDWQTQQTQVAQQQQQKINADQAEREDAACASELELIDQGLQHSVASLEQALQQVRLEQRLLQHNRGVAADSAERNGKQVSDNSMWSENAQTHERGPTSLSGTFKLGSSLFSIFGNGGLPLPITSQDGAGGLQADTPSTTVSMVSSNAAAVSTTPFDFPTCDFLRESFPAFQFAAAARDNGFVPEYSLYESPVNKMESIIDDSVCIVCLEQPAGVRLMDGGAADLVFERRGPHAAQTCGHASFCSLCVQGLVNCPLCREKIVGLHQIGAKAVSPCIASSPGAPGAQRASSAPAVGAKRNGSSSYHLWNWVPGASV